MRLETISYDATKGAWSLPGFPLALDSERTLVVAFGAPELIDQPKPMRELKNAFPRSKLVGCSSAGEIAGTSVRDHSLSVAVARFEHTDLQIASLEVSSSAQSFTAGQNLARQLQKPALRAVFVLSEGLDVNGSELVRGLNSVLDPSVVVTGGLSGDGTAFKRTWVALGDKLQSHLLVAVGLYGEHIVVGHGSKGGWDKFGPERVVTKSAANVLYELDNKPALTLYKEYLGDKASGLPATGLLFPLALRSGPKDDKVLVRTLLAVDEAKQSMTFAGDLPQGSLVQLMKADYDRLIGGASGAALSAAQSSKQLPAAGSGSTLALAISCVGRRLVLGERTEEEVEAVLDVLPKGSQIVGFYSYGEISPYASGQCDLHNQTMTLTTLSESPTPLPRAASPERSAAAAALPSARPLPRPAPSASAAASAAAQAPAGAAAIPMPPPAAAKAGNGALHGGNGKARSPMGSLDLDPATDEPNTPGAGAVGTVKMLMRGFRVDSFSYDATRAKWSIPGMPQALDSERTLIVAFGAPELIDQPKPFQELRRAFPRSKLVGCSSAGEIAGTSVHDHSLSVAVARFESTDLATAALQVNSAAESFSAGQSLARQLQKPSLRALFVLSEGLNVNGSELVRGLNSALDPSVVVTGGLSGDGTAFKRTWVALGDKLTSGLIVAVGFYGDHLVIGHGSKGGWDKFGPERVVTKSSANVLYELDSKPALTLYKEYLGDKASGLPATGLLFPLALRSGPKDDKVLVRTLLAVDEAKQSMTFAGDLPQGSLVQLMKADYDRLISGASGAAQSATQLPSSGQGGTLAVAVSCVGRRLVLGERTEEEVEAVLNVLPKGSQIVGFYSYGEISPYASGQCDLHNQTMTLTTFSESPVAIARPAPAGASAAAPAATPAAAPAAVVRQRAASASTATPTPMAPQPRHAPAPAVAPVPDLPPISVVEPAPEPTAVSHAVEPETLTGARPVRLTVNTEPQSGLSISKKMVGAVQVVSFAGRLSESFQGARVGAELAGTVVLDLSGVSRITSFGVREWLQMLAEAENRVEGLYLARCSEAVSNQLTMIRRFAGKGHVVSFYAPYLCSGCGTAFAALVDCVRDGEAIKAERPPEASCPRCAKAGAFDDDPRTYLTFGGQATHVPDEVRRALAALEPDAAFEALEKRIDGDTTRVRVASALDGSLRWTRVLEGVEGEVAIDLSGVPSSTGEGVEHLLEGVGKVDTEVRVLKLEGVPAQLLAPLADASISRPKLELTSTRVEGYCATCQATRTAEVRLDGNLAAIAKGQMPEVTCKRCQGPLTFDSAVPALRTAAKALLKKQRPAARPAPKGSRPAPSPRVLAFAGAGVVALLVLLWGAVMLTARARTGLDQAGAQVPGAAAAMVPGTPAPAAAAAAPANPNAWRSETGLLPGWADNPVAVQSGGVYVVGRGAGATEDEALAAARAAATDRLVSQLLQSLQGKPIADVVRASGAEGDGENAGAVAQRFQRQLGANAAMERTETAVRGQGGQQEMVARYRIGQDAFKAAVDRYSKTVAFRGITVAPFFPALERTMRTEGELVVVASKLPDVKVGDVLLSVGGKPVSALEALGRIALETAARPAPAGLQLQLERGGEAKTVTLGKPAKPPAPGKGGG